MVNDYLFITEETASTLKLQLLQSCPEPLFLLQQLREAQAQLCRLRLDICQAQAELPLLGGGLGGAFFRAVADVSEALASSPSYTLPLGSELLAPQVLSQRLRQPLSHPRVRKEIGYKLRRTSLDILALGILVFVRHARLLLTAAYIV